MSYLINGVNPRTGLRGDLHGYGLGYVGDAGALGAASPVAAALSQSQAEYDRAAAALRNQLKAERSLSMTGIPLTSSQLEAEVVKRLGKRPSVSTSGQTTLARQTQVLVRRPTTATEPIFGGSAVGVAGSGGGISTLHIVGGIALVGLIALAVKGT